MRKLAWVWIIGCALFGIPWSGVSRRPHLGRLNLVPLAGYRRRDVVLNFAYYLPFGMIGIGLGAGVIPILSAAAVVSGLTEALQVFSLYRYPSVTDLVVNLSGAAVGIVLALGARSLHRRLGGRARVAPGERSDLASPDAPPAARCDRTS